ncbi:MAG: hypothetical protein K9H49_05420 [Bacteroidales bacterium]|nr:hypothetical protein [Bacteroidales bacterium]MCF8389562.1 hypothetical protein [Bacteroidales bacterium]
MFKSIYIYSILLAALVFSTFQCIVADKQSVIYAKDYGFGASKDCSSASIRMIEAAREKNSTKIIIERGTYHFYPDKAFEKYCNITNHDDGIRYTPFPIIDFSDIEIEADSAEFIFHGIILPFIIDNSENVKLSGFSIDWEVPLYSQVKVIATDESNHTFDIEIDQASPYGIRNGELIFFKEGYEHNLERAICWNPETMAVAYNTWAVTPLTLGEPAVVRFLDTLEYQPSNGIGTLLQGSWFPLRELQNCLIAEELQPGVVRLSGQKKELPRKGIMIVSKGQNGINRLAPAIHIRNAKDVVISEVTVHHAGGMGLVAERSENIFLNHFNVALKNGSGRMLTTTADATHFNNCRGLIRISDCLFENMLDDAANIHGVYGIVEDIIDTRTLGILMGHFQQLGFDFVAPGDQIGFIEEGTSFFPFANSEVSSIQKINGTYYIIKFNEAFDPAVKKGILLDNLDWYPEVEFVNNIVRNNRARGLLINTRKKTTCEGNYFSPMDEAISFHFNFGGDWYESGFSDEVIIRNNFFADCSYAGRERAVINFSGDESQDTFIFKKIVIENNKFKTFDPFLMNPVKVDTLIVRNNSISKSNTYPGLFTENPAFRITQVNFSLFSGNKVEDYEPGDIIIADSISLKKLHQDSNSWKSQ